MNIVIPSYNRWEKLAGKDYFKSAKYVVPKSQARYYSAVVGRGRIIIIPDECDGSIAKKRNWILKNVPRPLLMIDDDVSCLMMTEGMRPVKGKKHYKADEKIRLSPEDAENFIINAFNLAHQWGIKMWGVNVNTDGRNYQQYQPIRLNQPVLGPFTGHLDHKYTYDERMGNKEDYDMALQILSGEHKILRFNKVAYECEHGDNEGGIVSMRSMEKEMQYAEAIMKKWGRQIISYPSSPTKMAHILNGRVQIPIMGL